jgi:hypothetical protein
MELFHHLDHENPRAFSSPFLLEKCDGAKGCGVVPAYRELTSLQRIESFLSLHFAGAKLPLYTFGRRRTVDLLKKKMALVYSTNSGGDGHDALSNSFHVHSSSEEHDNTSQGLLAGDSDGDNGFLDSLLLAQVYEWSDEHTPQHSFDLLLHKSTLFL